jgi:hypothetical protein
VFSVNGGYEYSEYRGVGKDESFYSYSSRYSKVYFRDQIITEQELPILSLFIPHSKRDYGHSSAYAKASGYAFENMGYDKNMSREISKELGLKMIKSNFFKNINEELKVDVFRVLYKLYDRQGGVNSYYETFSHFYDKIITLDYLMGSTYHDEALTEETLKLYPSLLFEIVDVKNTSLLNKIIEFINKFSQVNPDTIEPTLMGSKIIIAKDQKDNIIATAAIKPIRNRLDYVKSILSKSQFVEETIKGYTFKKDNGFDGELGYCNVVDIYRGIGIIDYMICRLINMGRIFATTGNPAMEKILTRHGFCKVGQSWEGIYNPSLSLFIYNSDFYEKNMV